MLLINKERQFDMHVSLVGINHKTAPVAVREKVAISSTDLGGALAALTSFVPHGVILSTCNRTEVYAAGSGCQGSTFEFLSSHLGIAIEDLKKYTYCSTDEDVIEHTFRMASGLDSMVVGEFEILGQVGAALDAAEKAATTNLALRQLFRNAIRTGRRVRDETAISRNAVSVSSVAIDLIAEVFGSLEDSKMIVIGAGEAGRLVAKVAKERGLGNLCVTSRTRERAADLASDLSATAFNLLDLVDEMKTADVVVACTNAPHWIMDTEQVSRVLSFRNGNPLLMMDISVPRNIEPAIGTLKDVFLYNIDDLSRISEANRQGREAEIMKAGEIVTEETERFFGWWQTLKYRPVVTSLMTKAEDIRRSHLEKTLKKLRPLSDEELESLDSMTKAIVTKILHDPIQYLKGSDENNGDYAAVVSELFRLNREEKE
jgi:glutamyl-tRNA reductase